MPNEPPPPLATGEILARTRFFGDLSKAQLDRVAALALIQQRAADERVYRIGEPAADLYVLVSGRIRMTVGYRGRESSVGDVARRGDVFGWAAMTPDCRLRVTTTSCITPCTLLAINGERLLALMEADHTLGYRVMTQLSRLITGTLTSFAGG